jgi:hypothetical protein
MSNRLRLYHSHMDEAAPREAKPHPVNPNDPHSWVVWDADDFKAASPALPAYRSGARQALRTSIVAGQHYPDEM